jgi:tetratricopeptide (TPR) repeat protein
MSKKLLFMVFVVLAIFVVSLVFFRFSQVEASPSVAHTTTVAAAQTPDVATLDQDANEALNRAQDAMNTINVFTQLISFVLAGLGIMAAIIAFLGFQSYRDMRQLARDMHRDADEMRHNVEENRLSAENTRKALIYINVGDRLLKEKRKAEALENYQKAGELLPNDNLIQYELGRVYSGVSEYELAVTAFTSIHTDDRNESARVLKQLGLVYRRRGETRQDENLRKGDYAEAVKNLLKSVTLNPNDADAFGILGGLYRREHEYALAFESYYRAWKLRPASSYALGNLASLSWYLGKVEEAKNYFALTEMTAKFLEQADVFWDFYDIGLAQLVAGKMAEAMKTYEHAIQITPGKDQFEGVLSNLYLMRQATEKIEGLNDVIALVETARDQL